MNKKEKQIAHEFPREQLDAAINKRFENVNAESRFDFLGSMQYVTNFDTEDPEIREQVKQYIQGFTDGWIALREVLETK